MQGVQPKLSARLNLKNEVFDIVDKGRDYILKSQNNFNMELPENESLTMKFAETIGIDVPFNSLIYSIDGKFIYFIRRFDRYGKNKKLSLEDLAQLAGKSCDTKYDYSMEKLLQ
ncbi:MAG: HipA domain-containing protein [Ignavibacterium sp.]|uniref:HipA domain-containing protein n=1 Tax=Ignavibacterium sp. TaxID=2651167 RepID=UPI00404B27DD